MLRLPVLPCSSEKKPLLPDWPNQASADPDRIREMWRRYPGPLVGVVTGQASGFDVLDIDPRNGGRAWYEAHRAKIPQTRIHRTRSGGLHVFFKHLPGLRNSSGQVAPGVDVRADGGQVIWWVLERLQARGSLDALSEWPLWLLTRLMPRPAPLHQATPPRSASASLDGLIRTVRDAPRGQRNALLFWVAKRVVESGSSADPAPAALLMSAAIEAGLTATEAVRTIKSAMR